ncbi:MAG: hypothetical protein R3C17_16030 [Planctomycetaceae bacterium]
MANGRDREGKAADYKQARCIHMARQGVLALNLEWFGMGQLATRIRAWPHESTRPLWNQRLSAPFLPGHVAGHRFSVSLENADRNGLSVSRDCPAVAGRRF